MITILFMLKDLQNVDSTMTVWEPTKDGDKREFVDIKTIIVHRFGLIYDNSRNKSPILITVDIFQPKRDNIY